MDLIFTLQIIIILLLLLLVVVALEDYLSKQYTL